MKPWKHRFWREFALLFVCGLVLASVEYWWPAAAPATVACESPEQPARNRLIGMSSKIGEALIVAAMLALVVDRAAKGRLLEEFAMDISSHIIGRALPPELRKPIEDYLRSDFVRSSWRVTYVIDEWPGNPEYLRVLGRSEFEIQNKADEPKDFKFKYLLEESFFPQVGETQITRFAGRCLRDTRNKSFEYSAQSADKDLRPILAKHNLSIEKTVSIPPFPHSEYTCIAESVQCLRSSSLLPLFTYYLVLSTTLTIEFPADKLDVFLDISFGDVDTDTERTPLQNGVQWRFKKPMLPGHTFNVRMRRKKPPEAQNA